MNPKDATRLIAHLLGLTLTATQQKDLESLMSLIISNNGHETRTPVKDAPNELKPEENTISLQDVDHFELPKEINVQMEGEEGATRKIKIFPDGISETEPPAVN